jgi:dihydroorotase
MAYAPVGPPYDLLIVGGRVIDPASGIDAVADVAVVEGRIDAVGVGLCRDGCDQLHDASGQIICPGLVDTHVHIYDSMVPLGLDADTHCLARCTTTVVDAGSAGCNTIAGMKRFSLADSRTRILYFLHISGHGLASVPIYNGSGELDNPSAFIDVDATVRTIADERAAAAAAGEPSRMLGIKVRLSSMVANGEVEKELEGWRLAQAAAKRAGVPVMVHHSVSDVPLDICPGQMLGNDIYTHCCALFSYSCAARSHCVLGSSIVPPLSWV